MLRCNLSILLAERDLKITKVSKDTGISRTTLTALAGNGGHGIQWETLNTLCGYLKVSPSDIVSYIPYDFKVSEYKGSQDESTGVYYLNLILIDQILKVEYSVPFSICIFKPEEDEDETDVSIKIEFPESNHDAVINILKCIPIPFLNKLKIIIATGVFMVFGQTENLSNYIFEWDTKYYEYIPDLP